MSRKRPEYVTLDLTNDHRVGYVRSHYYGGTPMPADVARYPVRIYTFGMDEILGRVHPGRWTYADAVNPYPAG